MSLAERLDRAGHELLGLAYPDVGELLRAESEGRAVVLLPLGAIQPHGPHAPVGTDVLISRRMCRDACRELGRDGILGAILPMLPYGATPYWSELPGCFAIGPETVAALLHDVCAELARHGVRRCLVVNNNHTPDQVRALYGSAERAREELGLELRYMDITHPHRERIAQLPQAYVEGDFHAGRYETSLMLASDPDLVDEPLRSGLPDRPLDLVAKIREGAVSAAELGEQAYIGFPAAASAEEGEETYANLCAMVVQAARDMLEGRPAPGPGWYARTAPPPRPGR
jgi:creatinine amidohydrolase